MAGYRKYRDIFFAVNGLGPYECHFCAELVSFDDVHIHHLDHDHSNDVPDNLAAAHDGCHKRHHQKGVSKEERKAQGESRRGMKRSEESRKRISQAKKARGKTGPQSDETRKLKSKLVKQHWENDPGRRENLTRDSKGRFTKREG